MKSIKLKANAKINISLIITGIMHDGYHELDTVMCPVELCDFITVTRRMDRNIVCNGINISDDSNTAVKAARILMEEFDTAGVDIEIEKHIPLSAGLGGSSADAAGVMYAFSKLFNIDLDKIKFLARQVGSDLPFMLQVRTGAMRARGIGDILTAEEIEPLDIVLAKPLSGVDTVKAYQKYDELKARSNNGDNMSLISAIRNNENLCEYLVNDLYQPASILNAEIEPLLKLMKKNNKDCALMSGSGSAVFAIVNNKEEAKKLYDKIPNSYYKVITRTCKSGIEIVNV